MVFVKQLYVGFQVRGRRRVFRRGTLRKDIGRRRVGAMSSCGVTFGMFAVVVGP